MGRVRRIERVAAWIDIVRDAISVLLLIAIFGLLNLQVFYRYVLNDPLPWPEEIARLCFVWVAYIGIAKLVREQKFYAIDVFIGIAPFWLRSSVDILINFLALAAFIVVIISAWPVLAANITMRTATGIPMNFLYGSLPVAAAFIVFALVLSLLRCMARRKSGERT